MLHATSFQIFEESAGSPNIGPISQDKGSEQDRKRQDGDQ